ncbi:MAG TPA: hypothetical protein VFR70_03145, partial [Flavobacterium sp.]|nr:hypothetical protein [Flavobacterium sp.]
KLVIDCSKILESTNSFDIEIKFKAEIIAFRNYDYTWQNIKNNRAANEFASKIIKLDDGNFIQANINQGIWEVHKKDPHKLIWKFNPRYSKPIAKYVGQVPRFRKKIYQASDKIVFAENPTLLFSKNGALEISRSAIPFTAIACFTDHCDFDTSQNLQLQRKFFAENEIKVTKSFFMNHYSKRSDNASYEKDKAELDLWKSDGHELCYHSLSQSIKPDQESFLDFKNFQPPYDSSVWIDHGFQPYNFTLFNENIIDKGIYESQLHCRKINTLWNYIDSGSAAKGVINQLNTSQFTLASFSKGIKNYHFKNKIAQLFKNIIYHYDNDEKRIRNYMDTIEYAKNVFNDSKISSLFPLFKNALPLLKPISKALFFWNSEKSKIYKLARYSPLVFKHTILEKEFYIFQTLEMVDFKNALHRQNVDLLVEESGIFIAHTYFSVNMKHYSGKLFKSEGKLDEEVAANFRYLGSKIAENKIWNPTLSELIMHFKTVDEAVISIDEEENLYVKNNQSLAVRIIN